MPFSLSNLFYLRYLARQTAVNCDNNISNQFTLLVFSALRPYCPSGLYFVYL